MTRVVVSGLGAVTPIGATAAEYLQGLLTGASGIRTCSRIPVEGLLSGNAAMVEPFPREPADVEPTTRLAICAGREALADAQVELGEASKWRAGIALGTCLGGLNLLEKVILGGNEDAQSILPASACDVTQRVAMSLGLLGESRSVITACAAGTNAIAAGMDLIRSGQCDVVLAGGADALATTPFAGFSALRALDPERCRPFDAQRAGLTIGEGAAMLVLESEERARTRGARVYAELLGYGMANDAYHAVTPDPQGFGALRAMRAALADAGISADEISYINAHGTGTWANDEMEMEAFTQLLGDRRVPISSTKSQVGHTMGGAGAMEAVACCLALMHGFLPATVGLQRPERPGWDFVPCAGRRERLDVALSTSFGFGGTMACLVLARHPFHRRRPVAAATDRYQVSLRSS